MSRGLRILAFVAIGLAIHVVLSRTYLRVVVPQHKVTRADALWAEAPPVVDLLVIGDSHPRSAVVPRIADPTIVNLATGGEHYTKTWYRLRALLAGSDRTVRAIVVPVDPTSFAAWHAADFVPEAVWGRYVDFLEVGRVRGVPWTGRTMWVKAHLVPYAGELRTFNQLRANRFGFADQLASGDFGAQPVFARVRDAYATARQHLEGDTRVDATHVWAFRNILDLARDRGIAVVAVSYPLTDAYLTALDDMGARGRAIEVLAAEAPTDGIVRIDATTWFEGHPERFADPHHLNHVGRTLFTRELVQRLRDAGVLPAAG